eukprot:6211232-Pleurochrysis_carterae.AAC.5
METRCSCAISGKSTMKETFEKNGNEMFLRNLCNSTKKETFKTDRNDMFLRDLWQFDDESNVYMK